MISFCFSLKVLSTYVIIFGKINRINIFKTVRRKRDVNMHVIPYNKKKIINIYWQQFEKKPYFLVGTIKCIQFDWGNLTPEFVIRT